LRSPRAGGANDHVICAPCRTAAPFTAANFLSPYVRRVAVSLNLLELPFELEELFVFKEPDVVRRHNPLVRIPVLVLDDGANLVESSAILYEIEHLVSRERRLTPSEGLQRRRVVQTAAIALACAEKAQWASMKVA
jgi:glutathione S-transferase